MVTFWREPSSGLAEGAGVGWGRQVGWGWERSFLASCTGTDPVMGPTSAPRHLGTSSKVPRPNTITLGAGLPRVEFFRERMFSP